MNLLWSGWRCVILLLSFSMKRCPLLLAGSVRSIGCGFLTVEPSRLFRLGSDLNIYCHNTNCEQWARVFLLVNGERLDVSRRVNSTTAVFTLANVRTPSSTVLCRLQRDWENTLVSGLSLNGGLPPDKPRDVRCETWRSSPFLECTWERGWETYFGTSYSVSVVRDNGTLVASVQALKAGTVKVPRSAIDEDSKYRVSVEASNHFGSSQSEPVSLCFEDMVIPEAPHIEEITFEKVTVAALLRWNATESPGYLGSSVRLRAGNSSIWIDGEATEPRPGLVRVHGLAPLTEYAFLMRTCHLARTPSPGCSHGGRTACSRWSPPTKTETSPGKGPSQQLHVWRVLGHLGAGPSWNVTVLWKPPPPGDYSGRVQHYRIFHGDAAGTVCPASLSRCTLQVPAGLRAVSVSAVTLYGASPPAEAPLTCSGESGTPLTEALPADGGTALVVSWRRLRRRGDGGVLHYVLEWAAAAAGELQWRRLENHENRTSIGGLSAGVRYNVSLYAVTRAGVSQPSSRLVYSREQEPASGPRLTVLLREPGRILVRWERLPVAQRRGFITGYSIYLQTLDSSSTEHRVTVNGSEPGRRWLDCPEASLVLQATASTSAGEGLRGIQIYAPAAGPQGPDDLSPVVVPSVVMVLVAAVIVPLMCAKERIKKKCLSWKPACLDEPLLKPGNSVAIRLLKMEGNEPSFSSSFPDPPLSPIRLLSQDDQEDLYPSVHVTRPRAGSGRLPEETAADAGAPDHGVVYKPQVPLPGPQEEDAEDSEDEQWPSLGDGGSLGAPGGLLGTLFPGEDEDRPRFCSLWPQAPPPNESQAGLSVGRSASEDAVSSSLESPRVEITDYAPAAMYDGYFPQAAPVCSPLGRRSGEDGVTLERI